MVKKIVIALLVFAAIGGAVYKVLNPSDYKHPLHR